MKGRMVKFQVLCLISTLLFSVSFCQPIGITSLACTYDNAQYKTVGEGSQYYIYDDNDPKTLKDATAYCKERHGMLATPTPEEAKDLFPFLTSTFEDAVWLGQVKEVYEKNGIRKICQKYYKNKNVVDVYCDTSQSAYVVCQCMDTTEPAEVENNPAAVFLAQQDHKEKSTTTATTPVFVPEDNKDQRGRMSADDIDVDGDEQSSSSELVSALAVCLAVACLVGASYGVAKHRGWNVREMISSRMPYNHNRDERMAVNGTYSPGQQELVDMTSHSQPIHVYEEIIPRGQLTVRQVSPQNVLPQDVVVDNHPPTPPLNTSYGNDMHKLSLSFPDGTYLNPNHRGDLVPGDVRSPLPVATMFKYPMKTKSGKIKEIHYASVETVQTDVEDTPGCSSSEKSPPVQVDVAEYNTFNETDEPRVTNRYSISPATEQSETVADTSALTFKEITNDYENERFLRTIMKSDSTGAKLETPQEINNTSEQDEEGESSSVCYDVVCNEPTYAKINKSRSKEDVSSYENSEYMMPVSTSTPTASFSVDTSNHDHDNESSSISDPDDLSPGDVTKC